VTAEKGCALERWQEIADGLTKAPLVALFLNFDGTLAEFCVRPEDVVVRPEMQAALRALARSERCAVWIVSGRRHADLRDRVGVPGIRYLGLYGWEAHTDKEPGDETRKNLACVAAWMKALLTCAPGVWIEEKQHTVAVHHRAAQREEAELAEKVVNFVVGPFAGQFRIENGKTVWEVVPRELGNKSEAVKAEFAQLPRGTVPVYVGDDVPDEAAFAALRKGVTVHVGDDSASHAQYRLAGVDEVQMFLCQLQATLA
jgi:trehalose-phosphatase